MATEASDLAVLTVENKITVAPSGTELKGALPGQEVPGTGGRRGRGADCGAPGNAPTRLGDGIHISGELKLPEEPGATLPWRQSARTRRRTAGARPQRRVGWKKGHPKAPGLPLKIVLKKNPVKEKQWVSRSCGGGPELLPEQAGPQAAPGDAALLLGSVDRREAAAPMEPQLGSDGTPARSPAATMAPSQLVTTLPGESGLHM